MPQTHCSTTLSLAASAKLTATSIDRSSILPSSRLPGPMAPLTTSVDLAGWLLTPERFAACTSAQRAVAGPATRESGTGQPALLLQERKLTANELRKEARQSCFEWSLAYLSVLVVLASPLTSFRQVFQQYFPNSRADCSQQRCRGECTLDADNLGRERDGSGAGTLTRARRWREDLVGRDEASGLGATRGVDLCATRERTWDLGRGGLGTRWDRAADFDATRGRRRRVY
ncbi:hypothetical protein MKEN_00549700 [Mycena kentingensis (nom. inval.)]|nr:hypothetical protein MKEN_00549700 [Mycena kentingensis (nom. inval.)]